METSTKYKANIYRPVDKRPQILTNAYCVTVKEFMSAMITSGYAYESNDQLCEMAIGMTDKLIEKVGEKL